MISKHVFVNALNTLSQEKEKYATPLFKTLVSVLEDVIEYKEGPNGASWLRWWIETNDFGRNHLTITFQDHEEEIETPEELYDLLVFKKMRSEK